MPLFFIIESTSVPLDQHSRRTSFACLLDILSSTIYSTILVTFSGDMGIESVPVFVLLHRPSISLKIKFDKI